MRVSMYFSMNKHMMLLPFISPSFVISRYKLCSLVMAFFIVLTCKESVANPGAENIADTIFYNGSIYTVDDKNPWVEAVAIKDDEIIYTGSLEQVKQFKGNKTISRNLEGKMLLPGFIDSHAHPVMGGAYIRSLSLDSFSGPDKWVEQTESYIKDNPDKDIIFGYGFLASAFGPQGPTKGMLDKLSSDKAIFIMDEGFHGAWANSKALALLAIDKDTVDPEPGFSYYKRDLEGNPTGYLLEGTATDAIQKLGIINIESVALGTGDVIAAMNQYGITAVFDAGASDLEGLQLQVLKKLDSQREMSIRMVASHMITSSEQAKEAIAIVDKKRSISKHDMFHINTLKIMNDGTIEGKTASMFEDYQGEPGNKGLNVFSQQQMNTLIAQASEKNIDVHIHALGERAISETLNAIEAVRQLEIKQPSTSRYTICHIQVMTDEDIERFARLNVIAQSTPLWASFDEYGKGFVSEDQFQRYFRFNSLHKAGVNMSFGSDFPASGAGVLGISPLFNMEIGMTRQEAGQKEAPIQPGKHERLEIATLIKGYTLDGAYQLHMEDEIGSIEVGKKADFVILDKNLFEVENYDVHKVKVLETILAGKTIYSASKH